jgi:hypothetical protein
MSKSSWIARAGGSVLLAGLGIVILHVTDPVDNMEAQSAPSSAAATLPVVERSVYREPASPQEWNNLILHCGEHPNYCHFAMTGINVCLTRGLEPLSHQNEHPITLADIPEMQDVTKACLDGYFAGQQTEQPETADSYATTEEKAAEKAMRALASPVVPLPAKPAAAPSYGPGERRDLDRMIDDAR